MTLFVNTVCSVNLIHDIGYLDCSMTYSLELLVFCDEVISWLKRYLRAPEITGETLASDLIHEVGPDGTFLDTEHTLKHVRDDWHPNLFDRFDFDTWKEKGATSLKDRANEKVRNLIENQRPESLPNSVVEAVHAVRNKYL